MNTFNCPNFRGVMRRHMQARMYSRPHKRFVKMISTNGRSSKGIIPDPEEKMIIIWFHMGKPRHYHGKWNQTGRNFWEVTLDELTEFYEVFFRENVRLENVRVPTKKKVERRVTQSCADYSITATYQ